MKYHLHFGDGIEFMRQLPDGAVDHVMTDPPYGEETHKGARTRKGMSTGIVTEGNTLIDFDHITHEQFITLCTEAVRVAKRWVVMTCEWRHAALAEQSDLPVVRLGVWVKPNAAPQFTGDRPGMGWESVLILHREGAKRWNDGGHHAVWTYNVVQGEYHRTQKPLPLLKKWISQFTDVGETILDPMMGSATTGVASLQLERNFIGCEIDKDNFAKAEKRIQETAMQPLLLEGIAV